MSLAKRCRVSARPPANGASREPLRGPFCPRHRRPQQVADEERAKSPTSRRPEPRVLTRLRQCGPEQVLKGALGEGPTRRSHLLAVWLDGRGKLPALGPMKHVGGRSLKNNFASMKTANQAYTMTTLQDPSACSLQRPDPVSRSLRLCDRHRHPSRRKPQDFSPFALSPHRSLAILGFPGHEPLPR
jgi:hypothetical protein